MGFFANTAIRAMGERRARRVLPKYVYKPEVDSYGFVDVTIRVGDVDGSGDAPGVQLEFEHRYTPGVVGFAASAHEAELIGRALIAASKQISPSDRLKTTRRKWQRDLEPGSVPDFLQPQLTPRPQINDPEMEEPPF